MSPGKEGESGREQGERHACAKHWWNMPANKTVPHGTPWTNTKLNKLLASALDKSMGSAYITATSPPWKKLTAPYTHKYKLYMAGSSSLSHGSTAQFGPWPPLFGVS
jgi:hypothetical protein